MTGPDNNATMRNSHDATAKGSFVANGHTITANTADDEASSASIELGFVPSPDAADTTNTAANNTTAVRSSVMTSVGAHAIPGISGPSDDDTHNNTSISSLGRTNPDQQVEMFRRMSSKTRVNLLRNAQNGRGSDMFEVAEATLVPEEAVMSEEEEDATANAPSAVVSTVAATRNTSLGEDSSTAAEHSPTVRVYAEPLKNKCVLSRRNVMISSMIGALCLVGLALGIALPNATNGTKVEPDLNEILTYAPENICSSHIPLLTDLSRICIDPLTLPKGGPFCQLVADGMLSMSPPDVDFSLINAGGQRGDVPIGNVTYGDVLQYLPFVSNTHTYVDVMASELKTTLEDALVYALQDGPGKASFTAGYPYASGLRYDVDLSAPEGSRINNLKFNRRNDPDQPWTVMDMANDNVLYRVVAHSFLANGGDGYFAGVPEERKTPTEIGWTESFIDYCRQNNPLLGPVLEEMSTQEFNPGQWE